MEQFIHNDNADDPYYYSAIIPLINKRCMGGTVFNVSWDPNSQHEGEKIVCNAVGHVIMFDGKVYHYGQQNQTRQSRYFLMAVLYSQPDANDLGISGSESGSESEEEGCVSGQPCSTIESSRGLQKFYDIDLLKKEEGECESVSTSLCNLITEPNFEVETKEGPQSLSMESFVKEFMSAEQCEKNKKREAKLERLQVWSPYVDLENSMLRENCQEERYLPNRADLRLTEKTIEIFKERDNSSVIKKACEKIDILRSMLENKAKKDLEETKKAKS